MDKAKARELRKNMTEAEETLWRHLRLRQFEGHKFRRQQPIGKYIVDFVCFEKRLIIEVDGGQHAERVEYDSNRKEWLEGQGFRILRFWNNQILKEIEGVKEVVMKELCCQSTPPPPSSPTRGEEIIMKANGNVRGLQTKLLRWFKRNARDLPWRNTRNPYAIWVSEIMLQQTQVDTVIPYYRRFLKVFPTLRRLAKADLSEVLSIWEGLGYYSRARNLHRAAKETLHRFKGKLPQTPEDLLSLPGIGRYTAGAILSIAFNKEAPILDGNVKRVLSRLFTISGNPGKNGTNDLLWNLSESLVPNGHASSFNQALMDLGAMVCTPKDPQCNPCPLVRLCKAKTEGNPEKYPTRKAKKRIPHIHAVAAILQKDGKVLLVQRPPKGLLGGLWEFPNWKIEEKWRLRLRARLKNHVKKEMGLNAEMIEPAGIFDHTFTHFKLTLHVHHCNFAGRKNGGTWVAVRNLHLFPMSRLHRKIAQTLG